MPREARAMASEIMATPPKVVIASAVNLTSGGSRKRKPAKPIKTEKWQLVAWEWYDEIPEYRSACTWMGSMLSRAKLYPTKDGIVTTDEKAVEAMNLLFGGALGQAEMLRQFGIQFTVAGEAYLVGEDGGGELADRWYVVAATEIQRTGTTDSATWKMGKKELKKPLVIRMWRPHPRTYFDADSPSRPALPILAELDGLTKHVAAQIDSRLIGGGLLLFPEEMTVGTTAQTRVNENGEKETSQLSGADLVLETLLRTFTTAISNREDASALAPVIASGPGEHLDKVRLIDFFKELDAAAKDLRDEAIRRLALSMDLPPEILTGTGDVNHWGAWQIDETSVKAYAEPLLAVITSSLAEGYLRPYLMDSGMSKEEAQAYGIGADTAELRLRPNRSKEAIELYDRGELSAAAMLRENGFHEDDAMSEDERALWATKRLAGGTPTPEAVVEALRILGVNIDPAVIQVSESEVTPERPTRSLEEHPANDPPDIAAADVLVFRALERAGNRAKSKHKDRVEKFIVSGVAACDLYRHAQFSEREINELLEDAWAHCDRFCNVPSHLLNIYTTWIIASGTPHSRDLLAKFLADPRTMRMVA